MFDPEDDFDVDDEEDADDDVDADDDEPTIRCPYCRRQIHEDSQRCPYCEQYISAEDSPAEPKPWWIVAGVILCLLALLYWLVG